MSYLRANGRIHGRVSGRWLRASVSGRYQLGDVSDMGTSIQVTGDPVLALIAQLNRFAGKTLTPPGCGARKFVSAAFPMVPGAISDAAATSAVLILESRYSCAGVDMFDPQKAAWARNGLVDPISFVSSNLSEITTTIAQFGDSLGLEPASYGITTKNPLFKKKLKTEHVIMLGGVALAAIVLLRRS